MFHTIFGHMLTQYGVLQPKPKRVDDAPPHGVLRVSCKLRSGGKREKGALMTRNRAPDWQGPWGRVGPAGRNGGIKSSPSRRQLRTNSHGKSFHVTSPTLRRRPERQNALRPARQPTSPLTCAARGRHPDMAPQLP